MTAAYAVDILCKGPVEQRKRICNWLYQKRPVCIVLFPPSINNIPDLPVADIEDALPKPIIARQTEPDTGIAGNLYQQTDPNPLQFAKLIP